MACLATPTSSKGTDDLPSSHLRTVTVRRQCTLWPSSRSCATSVRLFTLQTAFIVCLFLSFCRADVVPLPSDSSAASSVSSQTVAVSSLGQQGPINVTVGTPNRQFNPSNITFLVGSWVNWVNLTRPHEVVQIGAPGNCTALDGGFSSNGSSITYSRQFNTPGVYYYKCTPHCASWNMTGVIYVLDNPPAPSASTESTPTPTSTPTATSVNVPGQGPMNVTVGTPSHQFNPSNITFLVGSWVNWVNLTRPHDVVQIGAPGNCTALDGGFSSNGSSITYSRQFNTPGVYYYKCTPHCASWNMTGVIYVLDNSPAPSARTESIPTPTSTPTATSVNVPGQGPINVTVGTPNRQFNPLNITFLVGSWVNWVNLTRPHDVVQIGAPGNCTGLDGGFSSNGSSITYSRQFNTPGVYYYKCTPHCASYNMTGVVYVLPYSQVTASSRAATVTAMQQQQAASTTASPTAGTMAASSPVAPSTSPATPPTNSVPFTRPGVYEQTVRLMPSYRLDWTADSNTGILHVSLTFYGRSFGWMGLGFGSGMVNTDLVVCGVRPDGTAWARDSYTTDYYPDPDDTYGGRDDIIPGSIAGYSSGSMMTVQWSRPLRTGDSYDAELSALSPLVSLIFAAGSHVEPEYHGRDGKGTAKIDMFAGTVVSISAGSDTTNIYIVHGTVMLLTFGVLYPVGIICARFFKHKRNWLSIHAEFMLFGSMEVIQLVIVAAVGSTHHLDQKHAQIGIAIAVLIGVQIFLGLLSKRRLQQSSYTPGLVLARELHKVVGYACFLLGLVNPHYGFKLLFPEDTKAEKFYFAWLSILTTTFVGIELRGRYRRHKFFASSKVGVDRIGSDKNIARFTWQEVSQRVAEGSLWIVIRDNVYDVQSWLGSHPGGDKVILDYVGMDASKAFFGLKSRSSMSLASQDQSDGDSSENDTNNQGGPSSLEASFRSNGTGTTVKRRNSAMSTLVRRTKQAKDSMRKLRRTKSVSSNEIVHEHSAYAWETLDSMLVGRLAKEEEEALYAEDAEGSKIGSSLGFMRTMSRFASKMGLANLDENAEGKASHAQLPAVGADGGGGGGPPSQWAQTQKDKREAIKSKKQRKEASTMFHRYRLVSREVLTAVVRSDAPIVVRLQFVNVDGGGVGKTDPGEWMTVLATVAGRTIHRPYTIVREEDEELFGLIIKVYPTGAVSRFLNTLQAGDNVRMRGPLGHPLKNPAAADKCWRRLVMIAGGVGLTPFIDLIARQNSSHKQPWKGHLLFANSTSLDVFYDAELRKLAAESEGCFSFDHVIGDGTWHVGAEVPDNVAFGHIDEGLLGRILQDMMMPVTVSATDTPGTCAPMTDENREAANNADGVSIPNATCITGDGDANEAKRNAIGETEGSVTVMIEEGNGFFDGDARAVDGKDRSAPRGPQEVPSPPPPSSGGSPSAAVAVVSAPRTPVAKVTSKTQLLAVISRTGSMRPSTSVSSILAGGLSSTASFGPANTAGSEVALLPPLSLSRRPSEFSGSRRMSSLPPTMPEMRRMSAMLKAATSDRDDLANPDNARIMICGPPVFVRAMQQALLKLGIPSALIQMLG